VENLLRGLIVLSGEQPPLSHDLERLQLLAGVVLPEELLALQEFAMKARYSPEETPLSGSRVELLTRIRQLRGELESLLGGTDRPAIGTG
jgi:HEPN domain-containing protein